MSDQSTRPSTFMLLAGRFPKIGPAPIVAAAVFMENLDATIIVTALPAIAAAFGTTAVDASIGITAYLLALTVVLPASAWISDRFGARIVFCVAIGGFTAASIWCACSSSLFEFTAARVLQGASGALMSPIGRMLIISNTEKRNLMRAIATTTWPGLIAPVIAPPLGGLIVGYASWHWIFVINVPIGIVGILLTLRSFPRERRATPKPFDWGGYLLAASSLVCLIYGLDVAASDRGRWPLAAALVVLGGVLLLFAVRHAGRHKHPLMTVALMRIPTFIVPTLSGGLLMRIAIAGSPFLLPLLFQLGFGLSALDAGLLVLIYTFGNLIVKAATTPVLRAFGMRSVLLVNGVLISLSIAAFAFVSPETPRGVLWALLLVSGMVRSMQFTALNTLTFADVPPEMRSSASMMSTILQQVPASVGVAFAALALSIGGAQAAGDHVGLAAFPAAFLLMAGIGLLALPFYWRLDRDAGIEVSRGGR